MNARGEEKKQKLLGLQTVSCWQTRERELQNILASHVVDRKLSNLHSENGPRGRQLIDFSNFFVSFQIDFTILRNYFASKRNPVRWEVKRRAYKYVNRQFQLRLWHRVESRAIPENLNQLVCRSNVAAVIAKIISKQDIRQCKNKTCTLPTCESWRRRDSMEVEIDFALSVFEIFRRSVYRMFRSIHK